MSQASCARYFLATMCLVWCARPQALALDKPFAPVELEQLQLASTIYVLNNTVIAPPELFGPTQSETSTALLTHTKGLADNPAETTARSLARANLVMHYLTVDHPLSSRTKVKLEGLPEAFCQALLAGVFEGLSNDEIATFQEFRTGPGQALENWLFEARNRQTAQNMLDIETFEATGKRASIMEDLARHRLPKGVLPAECPIEVGWLYQLPLQKIRKQDGSLWGSGPVFAAGAELVYFGRVPLTNVVIVVELVTTGRSARLSPDQLEILGFNEATGFGNHNEGVAAYLMSGNLKASMPHRTAVFVTQLVTRDRIRVLIPDCTPHFNHVRTVVRLYSDQGCLGESVVFENGRGKQLRTRSVPKTDEELARDLLKLAYNYEKAGIVETARRHFQAILDDYPHTSAANGAKEALRRIGGGG